MFKYVLIIAVMVLLAAGAWFWFTADPSKPSATDPLIAAPVVTDPDADYAESEFPYRAKLSLSDGTVIILVDTVNGVLAVDGHGKTEVYKENDWLSYRSADMADSSYSNTLRVAHASQYKVILPDGSHVWLNAGSTLRYPIVFAGHQRRVELKGEAYFEIAGLGAHDPGYTNDMVRTGNHNPFVVAIRTAKGNCEVRSLQARLNIMAYNEEPDVHVTLLAGPSQMVSSSDKLDLKPGEHGLMDQHGNLSLIGKDNREEALAWKDGMFRFRNATIESIMKQIGRWYQVEVVFKDSITYSFTGDIQRTVPVSQVLHMLESAGQVHFQSDSSKIIVMR